MCDRTQQKVALYPDRFAAYRYPVFKLLSDFKKNDFSLTIYADDNEDIKGLKLVDPIYCDTDYSNGGVLWNKVRNCNFKGICLWQIGVVKEALLSEYDVHVYWGDAYRLSTWLAAVIAKVRRKKVVFWTHGIYGNEGWLKLPFRLSFYRLADAILLYGDYAKSLLEKEGFNAEDMYVIKNSLDAKHQNILFEKNLANLAEKRAEHYLPEDKVLLFVGRLEPQKSLQILVELLKLLNAGSSGPYKLMIIGDGSDKVSLEELVATYDMKDDVNFYGACFDDEVLAPLIMMADVCVSPGEVGLTAMHSIVYGTPVVTHDDFSEQMPEYEAIVPGRSGAFYRRGSIESLRDKVQEVIGLVESGVITSDVCRSEVLRCYTPSFQNTVFKRLISDLRS